jgi:hypothetical protein
MFNAETDQPADWMCFSKTRFVTWDEIEGAIVRAGSTIAAFMARKTGLPVDHLLCNRINRQPHFIDGVARAAWPQDSAG